MKTNLGLKDKERKEICAILAKCLASTYVLYLKTQNFHWNVKGMHFYPLHILFEKHYDSLADVIDVIAERIQALGEKAPGSFSAFAKLSLIKDSNQVPSEKLMIRELTLDHETLIQFLRKSLPKVEGYHDGASADLINKRLDDHEKMAWMLRSHLK